MTTIAVAIFGRAITIWEAIQKRSHEPIYKTNKKNWSKEIKSDNFCYRKVGRAITKWWAIEKSPILINYQFERVTKIILHFDGSNNIFADCTLQVSINVIILFVAIKVCKMYIACITNNNMSLPYLYTRKFQHHFLTTNDLYESIHAHTNSLGYFVPKTPVLNMI